MSYLLASLGGAAKNVLGSLGSKSGSNLFNKSMNKFQKSNTSSRLYSRARSDTPGTLGRSAADSTIDRTMGATYDGINTYSDANQMRRKVPMIANHGMGGGGMALKDRLMGGYSEMLGGKRGGMVGGGEPMDGIER